MDWTEILQWKRNFESKHNSGSHPESHFNFTSVTFLHQFCPGICAPSSLSVSFQNSLCELNYFCQIFLWPTALIKHQLPKYLTTWLSTFCSRFIPHVSWGFFPERPYITFVEVVKEEKLSYNIYTKDSAVQNTGASHRGVASWIQSPEFNLNLKCCLCEFLTLSL